MFTFSTDDIRPKDRFAHWCEVRARNLFGVTISLKQDERLRFRGRFSASNVGSATLSEMQATPYLAARTASDISRASSGSLCIYQQVGGAGWFDAKSGGEFIVPQGGLAVSHSDLPYITTPMTPHGFDLRVLKIPLAGRDALASGAQGLPPSLLRDAPHLQRLVSVAFNALVADAAKNPEADFDRAVEHLAQLVLLACGRAPSGTPASRAALRFGCLHAARDIIARDLHRPGLTPAAVAAELSISLRQLHMLFEPTGSSFARTLSLMRARRAWQLLRDEPMRPVIEIAHASGFDSPATFYRVFRGVYGMTPSDARMAASAGVSSL